MKIFYGFSDSVIDVSEICYNLLKTNNTIVIPGGDINRAHYFGDPLKGVKKNILIHNNDKILEYTAEYCILINILTNEVTCYENDYNYQRLIDIQSRLSIKYGSFNEEFPEQLMVSRFLNGSEKVLEIGGNIGRNSLIIASILENSSNLVTLECDDNISKQLEENKNINSLNFHIEASALSNRKLIQLGWDTMPSEELIDGYSWVNTITLNELNKKYSTAFDTLVLDCEGAFYYILQDMPDILDNIKLIIMENDYHCIDKKKYVDDTLITHNFSKVYVEAGGWGPCYYNFFEVWKKY